MEKEVDGGSLEFGRQGQTVDCRRLRHFVPPLLRCSSGSKTSSSWGSLDDAEDVRQAVMIMDRRAS